MKLTITIFLLLSTSFLLHAKNYESIFGNQSTQWNMTYGNLWGMGSTEHTVVGDTLINGKEYKVIDGYGGYSSDMRYLGFLREDTVAGKAWYCNSADTTEKLIMDMNLNTGDSMYIGGNWNPHPAYYKVDSVYYFNGRKHIQFDFKIPLPDEGPFVLIEGISSNMGFRFQDVNYINNFNPKLLCSYKDGTQIYGLGPCEITSQGIEDTQNEKKIEIFPNPFSDKIKIQILDNNNTPKKYKIIDVHGKQITKGEVNTGKTLNLANLISGIYLIIVTNENDVMIGNKKIVKE